MNTQQPPIANHTNISARGTKRVATSQLFLRLISSIDWGPNPPDPLGRPSASGFHSQALTKSLIFFSPNLATLDHNYYSF